jgi:hypothetical protein
VLAGELNLWQGQADLESKMRRQAEQRINELEAIVQTTQRDNHRLQLEAEQCKTSEAKYCKGMTKFVAHFEELKSQFPLDQNI